MGEEKLRAVIFLPAIIHVNKDWKYYGMNKTLTSDQKKEQLNPLKDYIFYYQTSEENNSI